VVEVFLEIIAKTNLQLIFLEVLLLHSHNLQATQLEDYLHNKKAHLLLKILKVMQEVVDYLVEIMLQLDHKEEVYLEVILQTQLNQVQVFLEIMQVKTLL
jgi:hypothetical protein